MINPHPGLPELEYVKPASLAEASKFLAEHEGVARPFSGGTDCLVRLRDGVLKLNYLVDIKGLDGTKEISFDPKKGLTIGAAVTMNRIASHPDVLKYYGNLAEAARSVASYQLRNRATVIGNICNASPAGDTIGTCMALDGVLNVHGVNGMREIPLSNFFLGPGKTVLKTGDVVVSITLPLPPAGMFGVYKKLGRNSIGDLSIVGVAVSGYPCKESPSGYRFRITLASVAPVPFEAHKAEAVLSEKKITADVIAEAAQVAMDSVTPIDDVRGSARYRKFMVRNLTREAISEVFAKISK
ncbi:MAG: xanthine dehydrogenase family protein subunit M [Anaerolineaceae bacterium]|nr:xanthine dehydrogenase family protein subunit M [Anaerolineaceae bacterium]